MPTIGHAGPESKSECLQVFDHGPALVFGEAIAKGVAGVLPAR
jgi:hypothetical protein